MASDKSRYPVFGLYVLLGAALLLAGLATSVRADAGEDVDEGPDPTPTAVVIEPPGDIIVKSEPQQQMTYGMDFERLWYWSLKKDQAAKLAKMAIKDCRVDYVRVAIDGAAEFNEGEFDWSKYDTELDCLATLKAANPDIKFFASPRPFQWAVKDKFGPNSPEGKNAPYVCFPLWIAHFDNVFDPAKRKFVSFDWQKAADYMVRNIQFLNSKGYKITYVDAKNENDRYFKGTDLAKMVGRMRTQLGDDMPIVVAPSGWAWKSGANWMLKAEKQHAADFFAIASSHNCKPKATPEYFTEIAKKLGKPAWVTEMHGFQGPDDVAAKNSSVLWQHIRAGFGGINDWLSLGNKEKVHKMFRNVDGDLEVMRVYYIFKQLVNTSGGGNYLASNIPGNLSSTAAFIKGDTLTVWVLNSTDAVVKDQVVSYPGFTAANSNVQVMWWGPDNPREGSVAEIKSASPTSFKYDMAVNTLYCFTVLRK